MALKSTIYKADIQISDMDRNYYQTHKLTLARHPSETDRRLMVRLLAFAVHAHENLQFTKGLSSDNVPDILQCNLSNEVECWIELGQIEEKRIRKACGAAKKVFIYTYQSGSATAWWDQIKNKLARFSNLAIYHLSDETTQAMSVFCNRNMQLQYSIQDGKIWLSDNERTLQIEIDCWKS